jgi:hypothetical protein
LRRIARTIDGTAAAERQLVWLLGAPRTGSTWLARMLGDHDRVHVVDEPLIGAHLGVRVESIVAERRASATDEDTVWMNDRGRPAYFFGHRHAGAWQPLLGDLVRVRLLRPLEGTLRRGDTVLVKEPHGSEGAEAIFDAVPTSRLLFLVRDPRDCADSVLAIAQHGWAGRHDGTGPLDAEARWRVLDRAARLWQARVDTVSRVYDRLPDSRRLLVRYEDLRARPREELARVVTWLAVPLTDPWLDGVVGRYEFERAPESQRGVGQHRRSATPGLWRQNLLDEEQSRLTALLAEPIAAYGYASSGAGAGAGADAEA